MCAIPEIDLITLSTNVDDFFHRFVETESGKKALFYYYGKRGSKRKMSAPFIVAYVQHQSKDGSMVSKDGLS